MKPKTIEPTIENAERHCPDDAELGVRIEPVGGWPADEYTGLGGNYVRDPATGLRSPAPPEI